jgi:hypothetical protein
VGASWQEPWWWRRCCVALNSRLGRPCFDPYTYTYTLPLHPHPALTLQTPSPTPSHIPANPTPPPQICLATRHAVLPLSGAWLQRQPHQALEQRQRARQGGGSEVGSWGCAPLPAASHSALMPHHKHAPGGRLHSSWTMLLHHAQACSEHAATRCASQPGIVLVMAIPRRDVIWACCFPAAMQLHPGQPRCTTQAAPAAACTAAAHCCGLSSPSLPHQSQLPHTLPPTSPTQVPALLGRRSVLRRRLCQHHVLQ